MENARRQLSMLISLAQSDGEFHEKEKAVIGRLARAHHISEEELATLMLSPEPVQDLKSLPYEEKFEYLYSIILLMKADNVILDSELLFCQKVANSLGFQLSALIELYPHVHVNLKDHHELRMLKKKLRNSMLA